MENNLLQEAEDPNTDPERLREILRATKEESVMGAVLRNPGLPQDLWYENLFECQPDVWNNPLATLYMVAWVKRDNEKIYIAEAVRCMVGKLWKDATLCSQEGKILIAVQFDEWWEYTDLRLPEFPTNVLTYFTEEEIEHGFRKLIYLTIQSLKKIEHISGRDRRLLDILEDWCLGIVEEFKSKYVNFLAQDKIVKKLCKFVEEPDFDSWIICAMAEKFEKIGKKDGERAAILMVQEGIDQELLDYSWTWRKRSDDDWSFMEEPDDMQYIYQGWLSMEDVYKVAYEFSGKKKCFSLLKDDDENDDDEDEDDEDDEEDDGDEFEGWSYEEEGDDPYMEEDIKSMWNEEVFEGLSILRTWRLGDSKVWVEAYDQRRGTTWYVSTKNIQEDWKQGEANNPPMP